MSTKGYKMAASKKAPAKSKAKSAPKKTASKATTKTKSASKPKASNTKQPDIFAMEALMTNTPFQFDKLTQDAADLGQAQMDAAMKSSTVFFKGMEDIMKTCMGLAQDSGEKASEAAKSLMSCKTLNEYTEAQTKVAQASFDDFMAGATKLSEMTVKVCTDAFEPINDQVSKSIKKASDLAA